MEDLIQVAKKLWDDKESRDCAFLCRMSRVSKI